MITLGEFRKQTAHLGDQVVLRAIAPEFEPEQVLDLVTESEGYVNLHVSRVAYEDDERAEGELGDEARFRVSYFSAFRNPQHLEWLNHEEQERAVAEGEAQQYKVVVTTLGEPRPQTFD